MSGGRIKTVAIYVRVSTKRQESGSETQSADLIQWAERRGFTVMEIVAEKTSAWAQAPRNRPGWCHILELASSGEIDAVCVWALDRVCRSGIADMLEAFTALERRGVDFLSLQEPYLEDIDASTRPLILSVLEWVAQQDSERKSAHVRAGMNRARAKGVHVGREPDLIDEGRLARLALSGRTQRAIAAEMGVTRSKVRRCMKSLRSRGLLP